MHGKLANQTVDLSRLFAKLQPPFLFVPLLTLPNRSSGLNHCFFSPSSMTGLKFKV